MDVIVHHWWSLPALQPDVRVLILTRSIIKI